MTCKNMFSFGAPSGKTSRSNLTPYTCYIITIVSSTIFFMFILHYLIHGASPLHPVCLSANILHPSSNSTHTRQKKNKRASAHRFWSRPMTRNRRLFFFLPLYSKLWKPIFARTTPLPLPRLPIIILNAWNKQKQLVSTPNKRHPKSD